MKLSLIEQVTVDWNHPGVVLLTLLAPLLKISPTFYEQLFHQYSFAKKLQSQTVSREKPRKTNSNKKAACKMLMKLTP